MAARFSIVAVDWDPEEPDPGNPVEIRVTAKNIGDLASTLWGRVKGARTGELIAAQQNIVVSIEPDETIYMFFAAAMPPAGGWYLKAEVGHDSAVDADYIFTITAGEAPTGRLEVTVLDQTGSIVPGAFVSVITAEEGRTVSTGYSDSQGGFSVELAPMNYIVGAIKVGYDDGTAYATVLADQTTSATVVCEKAPLPAYVHGIVYDLKEFQVIGIKAVIEGANIEVVSLIGVPETRSTTTGSDGRYSLEVPSGQFKITVSATNYFEKTVYGWAEGGKTTTMDFYLESKIVTRIGTLSGRVTASDTDEPLQNVKVDATAGPSPTSAYTNPDGNYDMALTAGSYEVMASIKDYVQDSASVTIEKDKGTRQDFKLDPVEVGMRKIYGRVTDAKTGNAIYRATVQIEGGPTTLTEVDGKYSIPLMPGTYNVVASALNYDPKTMEDVVVLDKADRQLNIALEVIKTEKYTLTISVDGDGLTEPPPGVYVFDFGTTVTIKEIHDINVADFDHWTVDGLESTAHQVTLLMDRNYSVVCYFKVVEVKKNPLGYLLMAAPFVTGAALTLYDWMKERI